MLSIKGDMLYHCFEYFYEKILKTYLHGSEIYTKQHKTDLIMYSARLTQTHVKLTIYKFFPKFQKNNIAYIGYQVTRM